MLVVPDTGECASLDAFLDRIAAVYHLYVNDVDPDQATTLADFVEPDWSGYVPVKCEHWSPAISVNGRAESNGDPIRWTRGSGGTSTVVYGYFVTDAASGPLLWAERRADGPVDLPNVGSTVEVLPRMTLAECAEPLTAQRGGVLVGDGVGTFTGQPVVLKGVGQLVGDGVGTITGAGVVRGGDLVGVGVGTFSAPAFPHGIGDLVGDALSTLMVPPNAKGLGDLVGAGVGVFSPPPIITSGDLVGDGVGTWTQPGVSYGAGDLVGDGVGTWPQPVVSYGAGDLVGDGVGTFSAPPQLAGVGDLVGDGDGEFSAPVTITPIQWWECQDNNSGSTVVAATIGVNAAVLGASGTSIVSVVDGPGTAFPRSFKFNGTSQSINIQNAFLSFVSGAAFTFAAWFKDTGPVAKRAFFGIDSSIASGSTLESDRTHINVRGSVSLQEFTIPTFTDNVWHHVLISRTTGNTIRVFVDGVESTTGGLTSAQSFSPIRVGKSVSNYWSGNVVDVRWYDQDVSAHVATIMAEKDL